MTISFTHQPKSLQRIVFAGFQKSVLLLCACLLLLVAEAAAQCNLSSSFTKIAHTSGTVVYAGTNGSPAVSVTTIPKGDASIISYCNITNGYRAGESDNQGAYRFNFSPKVNGIKININALSNLPSAKEKIVIKINNVVYNVTAADIACAGNCFGCAGSKIFASAGAIISKADEVGNGAGQVLIQGVGPIASIEYINKIKTGIPQGSVFEIFFNNSTCSRTDSLAPVAKLQANTATAESSIRIIQNPVKDALVISGLKGVNAISIYTAAGTNIANKMTSNSTETINAGSWAAGLYMVRIGDGKTITTKKIVKL